MIDFGDELKPFAVHAEASGSWANRMNDDLCNCFFLKPRSLAHASEESPSAVPMNQIGVRSGCPLTAGKQGISDSQGLSEAQTWFMANCRKVLQVRYCCTAANA